MIAVGADADIVLWDPTITRTITQSELHHGADYTPWEGFAVTGWPVATFLRGAPLIRDGVLLAEGRGGVIDCGQPDLRALP